MGTFFYALSYIYNKQILWIYQNKKKIELEDYIKVTL